MTIVDLFENGLSNRVGNHAAQDGCDDVLYQAKADPHLNRAVKSLFSLAKPCAAGARKAVACGRHAG